MNLTDLSGHCALITGATGGVGRSIVRTLAGQGAHIVIHYHQNREMAAQLKKEVEALGSKAFCVQADLASSGEVRQMAEEIERCFTPVDILVANAYIHLKRQPPLLQTPIEDYIEQYNGTVLQNLHLIHTFIPKLQQQGGGRYIGINTVASVNCLTTQAAYSTSKRALDGLLRTLAKEVAKDRILVNQILPGWVCTETEGKVNDAHYLPSLPLGHRGTAQDVANAVLFLASELSSYITGVQLPVCGGEIMPGM